MLEAAVYQLSTIFIIFNERRLCVPLQQDKKSLSKTSLFLSGGMSCQSPPELGRQSHLKKAFENTPIPQALKHPTLNQCQHTHPPL